MSKWLNLFLENEIVNRSDKSDRFDLGESLSGLSGRPQGLLDEKKVENNPRKGGDKSDRFRFEANMSPLSLRTQGLFPLNRDSLLYEFEERIAIAEYDGCQNEVQAECIAYQDAFISVLNAVPYDQERDLDIRRWLDQRITAAQEWLSREGVLFHSNFNNIPLMKQ